MIHNQVIDQILQRKSIRKYTDQMPSDEVIETIVRAGQQAPFAYQLGSLLLRRDIKGNPFHAPLLFVVCVDAHRFERIMEKRGWEIASNDLSLMVIGIQDAALMAENMVMAAESLGLGSCFLGAIPYQSKQIIEEFKLPPRVFPLVGLTMGYPAENPPPRPRYPMNFSLFENQYPDFDEPTLLDAMRVMDEGYLAQDYYRKANYMIPLRGERQETFNFDTYSWTEHISRKLGLWQHSPRTILAAFKRCGFHMPGNRR
ncbi:MAG: nitroreductase family protein [Anaerolineales bacterium]|jgi:nitroreductase|nr:nitroreductase family protein [Anaerolineales bacterium]